MKPEYVVVVLTLLSAVVVVLTRLRLSQAGPAGQHHVGMGTVNVHTGCGVVALVLWVAFLVGDSSLLGVIALFFYWLTALVGLLILLRWLPSRGRHSHDVSDDRWSDGPGLSILAHVGMLVGVLVFTWYFATQG